MDIRKLQRVIVDALEDVKAQDIKVFNTSHLTELFDRVVVASGTSNRQTKALASSVRDKVKEAGGDIVSSEGEDTGEWVLVDCGDAIVHILQPALRQYYNLEEIWGDKPVRMKLGGGKATASPRPAKATTKKRKPRPPARRARRPLAAVESRVVKRLPMKLFILAVGHKMPGWIASGFDEYTKRMPPELRIELREIKPELRSGGRSRKRDGGRAAEDRGRAAEGRAPRRARRARPRLDHDAARAGAARLAAGRPRRRVRDRRRRRADPELKARADTLLRISSMTLPHGMVRVLLAEQLYRAWSITQNHPYHRA